MDDDRVSALIAKMTARRIVPSGPHAGEIEFRGHGLVCEELAEEVGLEPFYLQMEGRGDGDRCCLLFHGRQVARSLDGCAIILRGRVKALWEEADGQAQRA